MTNYTVQYNDGGVVLNDDAVLPFVDIQQISGVDSGDTRTNEQQREGENGGFVDAEFINQRTIVIDATVYTDDNSLNSFLSQLKQNYRQDNVVKPLYMLFPGINNDEALVLYCKSLGLKYDLTSTVSANYIPIQIQLKAEDPLFYSKTVHSYSVVFDTTAPVNGRGYPKSYNYGYGATNAVAPGTMTVNNNGNYDTAGKIRISHVLSPEIHHDESGRSIKLNANVTGSDYVEMDLNNRTVKLNGQYNYAKYLDSASRWFKLQPGSNTLRLTGLSAEVTQPVLTVIYQDAYE